MLSTVLDRTKTLGEIKQMVSRAGGVSTFIMLSGSHLYGWPSSNSDFDYRGCYILKTGKLLALHPGGAEDRISYRSPDKVIDVELMELKKFLGLVLKMNCNILEHLFADHLFTTPEAVQLQQLIKGSLAKKGLYASYKGMAEFNYKKFILQGGKRTVKKYLYIFRAMFAGMHALGHKEIQPNMLKLNEVFDDPLVKDLLYDKSRGLEDDLARIKYDSIDQKVKTYLNKFADLYAKSDLPETVTEVPDQMDIETWLKNIRWENWDHY